VPFRDEQVLRGKITEFDVDFVTVSGTPNGSWHKGMDSFLNPADAPDYLEHVKTFGDPNTFQVVVYRPRSTIDNAAD
jgi:hypothetical protein